MMQPMPAMTQDYLRSILVYDPDSGDWEWKFRPNRIRGWNERYAGKPAGTISPYGYNVITIDARIYQAHRLAFLYMIGRMPNADVDHINRNRLDNRWSNLREATRAENHANKGLTKRNKSGFKGVSWSKSQRKWAAQICRNRRNRYIGFYDTKEAAAKAYAEAAEETFGPFARTS